MSDIKIQAARNEQSVADKASVLDKLKNKKRRTQTIKLEVNGEQLELTFQAISYAELDALQSKHQPTQQQRIEGAAYNRDTFPPALVAACSVVPHISEEDANEIWKSEEWSTGELTTLFETVSNLCMRGLDIPFTAAD
jgi:aspartate-semialdehyde dehydrogenase